MEANNFSLFLTILKAQQEPTMFLFSCEKSPNLSQTKLHDLLEVRVIGKFLDDKTCLEMYLPYKKFISNPQFYCQIL